MRLNSLALFGFCLVCAATSWAQEPTQDTQDTQGTQGTAPGEADTPSSNERAPLPERSVSDALALEQRLDKREQQMLQAGTESFLALWLPANVGEPSGAVILVPGDVENADGAAAVGPLRRKLPDAGWHSLSLTLPDPDGDPLPLRDASAEAAAAQGEPATTENAPAADSRAPAADGAQPTDSPEQRRQAHVERVMARIDAAIAFASQQQAKEIVLLGHGSGAYWAARYLNERKPANVQNLLMVVAELPAGFAPPLDELVAQLPVATGDFFYKDQATDRSAALKRLQASKRAKLPTYIQVAMKALPGNLDVQEEQLYRRIRGWLKLHIRAAGS